MLDWQSTSENYCNIGSMIALPAGTDAQETEVVHENLIPSDLDTDFDHEIAQIRDDVEKRIASEEALPSEQKASSPMDINDDEDLASFALPVLSEDALYGIAGDFVKLASYNSEADPAAILATFLVRMGVEFGPNHIYKIGDCPHYPRLFSVIVGMTAQSRKGTSAYPVKALFQQLGKSGVEVAGESPGPLSTGEGLVERVKDVPAGIGKNSGAGTSNDKRLFVLDQEFKSVLDASKRSGNTVLSTLLAFWDTGDVEPLIKHNKIKTTGAHLGIVTHITKEVLEASLSSQEYWSGLANRFLWIYADRKKIVPEPEPMDPMKLSTISSKIQQALTSIGSNSVLTLDSSSRAWWKSAYTKNETSIPAGLLGAVTNRISTQIIRLAMIYTLLDGGSSIKPQHLIAAQAMWQYSFDSARFIFSGPKDDSVAKTIRESLKQKAMTKSEIHKLFNNHGKKDSINNAIKALISQGIVELIEVKTGGRPKNVFSIRK
jgi:hypothetical protein